MDKVSIYLAQQDKEGFTIIPSRGITLLVSMLPVVGDEIETETEVFRVVKRVHRVMFGQPAIVIVVIKIK